MQVDCLLIMHQFTEPHGRFRFPMVEIHAFEGEQIDFGAVCSESHHGLPNCHGGKKQGPSQE